MIHRDSPRFTAFTAKKCNKYKVKNFLAAFHHISWRNSPPNLDPSQPSLSCQTECRYIQIVPYKKCLCPDPPRRKVPMSRLSSVQNYSCVLCAFKRVFVQTLVRSKVFMFRLSWAPNKKSCAAYLNICAFMSKLLSVQSYLCPDFARTTNRALQDNDF